MSKRECTDQNKIPKKDEMSVCQFEDIRLLFRHAYRTVCYTTVTYSGCGVGI